VLRSNKGWIERRRIFEMVRLSVSRRSRGWWHRSLRISWRWRGPRPR